MKTGRIIEKWSGPTWLNSVVVSKNNKFAGICRKIGNNNNENVDKLIIFDLSKKRTAFSTNFTCSGAALAISDDGSKLAVEYFFDNQYYTKITLFNTADPFGKQSINFETWFYPHAVAFSPDGSVLAAGCSMNEICFLDSSDGREIYRMKAHSGISALAFSQDGTLLAASSNWGLISLWAVPPFTNGARQNQVSPISAYTPGFAWDFNEDGNFEGWGEQDWQAVGLKDLLVKNGVFSATSLRPNPEMYSNEALGLDASKFSRIEINMRVSVGSYAVIYFNHASGDWDEAKGKHFSITLDNEFHSYIIDMGDVASWTGIINQIRLDLADATGAKIEIDYIHMLP